jgi:hypothetical protein
VRPMAITPASKTPTEIHLYVIDAHHLPRRIELSPRASFPEWRKKPLTRDQDFVV